jgi:hypothetical protein
MLRFDFYESADGETTIVTFPSGGIAIVDAHPSARNSRPPILDLINGKEIHFICLTHPHSDHGVDLVPIVQFAPAVGSFWHTVSDFNAFFFSISQVEAYPSSMQHLVRQMREQWAEFLIDLYDIADQRNIPEYELRSDLAPITVDGVDIYCLSPKEDIKRSFIAAYKDRLKKKHVALPDPNLLSAVLAFRYGEALVLLGADALKLNWEHAFQKFKKHKLPPAILLKIPHHGAANGIRIPPNRKKPSYLDLCSSDVKAVLFAGDAKHPNDRVYQHLRNNAEVYCLSNGRRNQPPPYNPLNIHLPGARAKAPAQICNPHISFEVDPAAKISLLAGHSCALC